MEDKYVIVNASGAMNWRLSSFKLESSIKLLDVNVNFQTFGNINENRDNVIVVCHASTGNSAVDEWWASLFKEEYKVFDTQKYFIICSNILGSCYGTTGPSSICPKTGKQYGNTFPEITVRDSVHLQLKLVREALGVREVKTVIGGSLGGMFALEWAILGKHFVKSIIPMCCGAQQSAWQIGINHLERNAIYMDPNYQNGNYYSDEPPHQGLSLARKIAMVSYRTHATYNDKFGRNYDLSMAMFDVESYLTYQGNKFIQRFDANAYISILKMSNSHDVGRERGGVEEALSQILQPTLIIGIDSDILYPLSDQQQLREYIPNAELKVVNSPHGHDGFLLEPKEISEAILTFLETLE